MNVLLDTSAYSHLQRGNKAVLEVLRRSETVAVSAIVLGELYSGFRAGTRWAENNALLERFLSKPSVKVLNVTSETALRYAEIDVYLRKTWLCQLPLIPETLCTIRRARLAAKVTPRLRFEDSPIAVAYTGSTPTALALPV